MGWTDSELALTALAAMLSPTTLFLSVLALVVGERPLRTGLWFYVGALGATLLIGVVAAFVLGNAAASSHPSTPKTWVAVIDVIASLLLLVFVVRFLRRPRDPKRVQGMIAQMNKVAASPVVAIIGAGATLANPGAFIPLALKDISETNPNAAQYVAEWVAFALISLLPLSAALIALAVAPEWARRVLNSVRQWLERNARTVAVVILLLLAAVMLRNGVAGLTG
jgi:threonine/homoserine/homoserine lactone efflux protein